MTTPTTPSQAEALSIMAEFWPANRRTEIAQWCPKGTKVYSRKTKGEKQICGVATGGYRHCGLEGCSGMRIAIRWPPNRIWRKRTKPYITMPCSEGMEKRKDGSVVIL